MQIPTYKRQSVTPQPKNTVMEQPDLSKGNAMMAWGDVVANGVPKAAMAVDEAYQAEQDFKFGLAKDDMNSSAQQALDGLKDDLNKKDPHDLFMDGSFDDYNEAYENAMAQAKEKSTGKLKGGLKRRADRYWEQLTSANRDIARQIYDKAQKEAGAYCAGQDLQSAVEDCDQARANESIDNAVGAGYMTWQEGDKLKQDAKYDIFINGVISGKPFEYEKKNGDKVAVNHQVGLDHDADLKMLEQAREELPNDKYNQLKSYVNNLWQVKADQIQSDRGNEYIDLYKRILDGDKTVTLEYIDNDPALDPVNLDGCQIDYRSRLKTLWKQMNPEEKPEEEELEFTSTGDEDKDLDWLRAQQNTLPAKQFQALKRKVYDYWDIERRKERNDKKATSGTGEKQTKEPAEKAEKAPSETEIKNFINLAKTRYEKGEIDGDQMMAAITTMVAPYEKYYSAAELVYKYGDDITKKLPADYQAKAKITMDSITEGLQNLVDRDSDIDPEIQLENLKTQAMGKLLDVIYEFSNKEGRKEEFDKACTDLMAMYTTSALAQQEKLAKEPTRTEASSLPAALDKLGDIEEYGNLIYFNNITGENVWLNRKVGNAFEKAADVTATGISKIVGKDIQWHYDGLDKAKVYFTDDDGFKYRIIDKHIYKEYRHTLKQIWPEEETKDVKKEKEEQDKARDIINGLM